MRTVRISLPEGPLLRAETRPCTDVTPRTNEAALAGVASSHSGAPCGGWAAGIDAGPVARRNRRVPVGLTNWRGIETRAATWSSRTMPGRGRGPKKHDVGTRCKYCERAIVSQGGRARPVAAGLYAGGKG